MLRSAWIIWIVSGYIPDKSATKRFGSQGLVDMAQVDYVVSKDSVSYPGPGNCPWDMNYELKGTSNLAFCNTWYGGHIQYGRGHHQITSICLYS